MRIVSNKDEIVQGIDTALEVVKATYGPNGGNICIVNGDTVQAFDDGYKALKMLDITPFLQRQGLLYIRDAATATWKKQGDGTSTTAIIAGNLIKNLLKRKEDPNLLCQMVDQEVSIALKHIDDSVLMLDTKSMAVDVATIAMHGNTELGEMIGGLVANIGRNGIVKAEPSKDHTFSIRKSSGIEWAGSVASDGLYNSSGMMKHHKPCLLFVDAALTSIKDDFWDSVFHSWKAKAPDRPLVVVCRGASGTFLATFLANFKQGLPMGIVTINDNRQISHIARACEAKCFSESGGNMRHTSCSPGDLGECEVIQANTKHVSIAPTESGQKIIPVIIQEIEAEYDSLGPQASDDDLTRKKNEISILSAAFGTIYVPYISASQFSEDSEMIDDGYRAATNCFDGVLPGGGTFAIDLLGKLSLIGSALASPLHTIHKDAFTCEDAISAKVYDPASTIKAAIINAASVAKTVIKTKLYLCPDE